MRVLLSAYACEPGHGSEPGVGWNLAKHLSQRVELAVLTRANNRALIEDCAEPWVGQVRWIYMDPPRWLTFWKRGGRGVQLFYVIWQTAAWFRVRKELKGHPVDLIHHATFGKYWIPSLLSLCGVPFIFGSVGGGDPTPPSLREGMEASERREERLKAIAVWLCTKNPASLFLLRRSALTLAATEQTRTELEALGVSNVVLAPQSAIEISDQLLQACESADDGENGERLKLVCASRHVKWKAVDLAIQAVAEARSRVDLELTILQSGPEESSLKSLARDLGAEDCIRFTGRLPGQADVYRRIAGSDALFHPAKHEAFGQVCVEALAMGVPVLCLDWAGPGMIVDSSCGWKVPPGSRSETVARFVDAIEELAAERAKGVSRDQACRTRAEAFSWPRLCDSVLEMYSRVSSQ